MQVGKYLKETQPIIYKSFVNVLENDHLSHAYLISGAPGTPLFNIAKFLAKSIICENPNPLACDECLTCMRFDDEQYADLVIIDGNKSSIKKSDVSSLEEQFELKAMEAKGIMIYIINQVENMTVEAVNSILKFLEEPKERIYAFLTTTNENFVLPTIISRCQILRVKQIDRQEVINEAVSNGVSAEDAELLSYFYNSSELISETLASDNKDSYLDAKEAVINLLEALNQDDKKEAVFYMQSSIIPKIKTKETARFFLDMLAECFEDIFSIQNGKSIFLSSYVKILTELSLKKTEASKNLLQILKVRNKLNLNVNIGLLLDHLIFNI